MLSKRLYVMFLQLCNPSIMKILGSYRQKHLNSILEIFLLIHMIESILKERKYSRQMQRKIPVTRKYVFLRWSCLMEKIKCNMRKFNKI